jgi:hypothetical protein
MGSLRKNRAEILAAGGAAKEAENDLKDIYTLKPAPELASERHNPPMKQLFGDFWLEGELSFLFSAANRGKSILATQIADCISKGVNCEGFRNEVGPQSIIYFDYELTDRQFFTRYSNKANREQFHDFSKNLYRASVNYPKCKSAKESARKILMALGYLLETNKTAKTIIIDNLTRIAGDITEGSAAFEIMTFLDQIKKEFGYSILVLGHTRKGDQDKYGINENDILGSSMLNNFIDNAFCIGANNNNPSVRYVKHTKARNGEKIGDVCIFEIEKKDDIFLKFAYRGIATEQEQLQQATAEERQTLEADILQMHRGNPAATLNNIARQINESGQYKQKIYPTTVSRIIAKAAAQEAAERAEQVEGENDLMPF